MKIDYLPSSHDNVLTIVVDGVSAAFVNALRRTILSELPVYACNEVVFYDNSGPLFDETVSHRVGLIPLSTPVDSDDDSRMVTLSLEAEGPRMVYSADLVSDDPEVMPIDDGFPIVKLGEGQRLAFNAECTVGYGREHVRWQAGLASYKNYPVITIDSEQCNRCESCVKACPVNILAVEGDALVVTDVTKCTFCRSCEEACAKSNEETLITVSLDRNKFIFTLESFGNMSAKDLLTTALKVMENKSSELSSQLTG